MAHLEAGLRSFDRTMPEEINRLVTDALSDIVWTPSANGDENLLREGVDRKKIHRVGNIMIDSLVMMKKQIESADAFSALNIERGGFALVTLHRPSNVDSPEQLGRICDILHHIASRLFVVFPVHPRTLKNLEQEKRIESLRQNPRIILREPLGYVAFMNLVHNSRFLLTDSGGVQEETTFLGIPCLTLRPNTERPVTVTQGTNTLCTIGDVEQMVGDILSGKYKKGSVPDLWDGNTAQRIVKTIKDLFLST